MPADMDRFNDEAFAAQERRKHRDYSQEDYLRCIDCMKLIMRGHQCEECREEEDK